MCSLPQGSKDYKQDALSLIWFPVELSPFAVYFVVILAIPSKIKMKYLKSTVFDHFEEFPTSSYYS